EAAHAGGGLNTPPPARSCTRSASQAVTTRGRFGATTAPSGSSSPVSSKRTTPLQSRLHPCSGWPATTRAASRSTSSKAGQAASWLPIVPPFDGQCALHRAHTKVDSCLRHLLVAFHGHRGSPVEPVLSPLTRRCRSQRRRVVLAPQGVRHRSRPPFLCRQAPG